MPYLNVRSFAAVRFRENVVQMTGDGDLGDRICKLTLLDPETARTPAVISGHRADTGSHHIVNVKAGSNRFNQVFRAYFARFQIKGL